MKLSEMLQIGDKLTVYTNRGSNWRLPVIKVNDDEQTAVLDASGLRNGISTICVEVKVSKAGRPYAER
jgi:hypothetical protein